jgi:type II secretory pathway pseudopilin PulG
MKHFFTQKYSRGKIKRKLSGSGGFTLIELTMGMLIIGFLSLFLLQFSQQLSLNINNVATRASTAQSVIRFSNLVRYDIAGAQDVYVHHNAAPISGSSKSCTSFNASNSLWESATGTLRYARGLFSLRLAEVDYKKNEQFLDGSWETATPIWVGYEVRQAAYKVATRDLPNFELWRVKCADLGGYPNTSSLVDSEKIINLGNKSSPSIAGDTYMQCFDDSVDYSGVLTTSIVICRNGATTGSDIGTASRIDYYKFILPYEGSVALLNKIKASELSQLRRRLDF